MSIRAKPTFVPLRYFLARYRPSKTANLTRSLYGYAPKIGKSCHVSKGGITRSLESSLLFSTIETHKTISNYSKAPRGLFVLVEVGRVFTAIAISPSKGSRQLLTRYAFRAGRNLPDKELRSFLLSLDSLLSRSCMSPCRSNHIFYNFNFAVLRMVSEDSFYNY